MPSETLSFKGNGLFSATLFRKNLTRFWPIWAVYTAILFFLLPANLLLTRSADYALGQLQRDAADQIISAMVSSVPLGAVFGLITAMALFSYLMNPRATQMLHALPIRREGLFWTNWLSGLWFFLAPGVVIFLITLLAQAALGIAMPDQLLLWLLIQTVGALFFFSFAACCAMFTGHILALPVFYGILNVLVLAMTQVFKGALSILLVGFQSISLPLPLERWLTPVYQLVYQLEAGITWQVLNGYSISILDLSYAAVFSGYCLLLAAAFTVIALTVYRRRQLERAGDLITVGWVRPIFQYGFGVCVGFTFGMVLYLNYFTRFGPWAYVLLVALVAAIGAFAGRMLLKKTLKVFREGWKGSLALTACLLFLLGGARADLFGYQRWTPQAEQVASVQIRGVSSAPYDSASYPTLTFSDPALVQQVIDIHSAVTNLLDEVEQVRYTSFYDTDLNGYEISSSTDFRLTYTLTDGRTVSRWYPSVPIRADALNDPASVPAQLQALLNQPEPLLQCYLWRNWEEMPSMDDFRASGGWLNTVRTDEAPDDLTSEQTQMLWQAVWEDLAAGRIHRYLLDDRERLENCYYTNLVLTLVWSELDSDGTRVSNSLDLEITVQKSATSLMSTLRELGLEQYLLERNAPEQGSPSATVVTVPVETEMELP